MGLAGNWLCPEIKTTSKPNRKTLCRQSMMLLAAKGLMYVRILFYKKYSALKDAEISNRKVLVPIINSGPILSESLSGMLPM